jgi:ubiquinone/menaquinone biosynthesis C-methylase UbiE
MPSLEWNAKEWGAAYEWPRHGDEWSDFWGGVETQWAATLLPRIRNFLPARSVLEIAPGHGRWSGYLIAMCTDYVGVDLSVECVGACKERFQTAKHARFFVNDGHSLPMVADGSVEFVFSFDSLVHVEADVIESYLFELSRVLAPDGIGFLHHSNLGGHLPLLKFARALEKTSGLLPATKRLLKRLQIIEWDHARAKTMSASRFVECCQKAELVCVGQEIIDWGPHTIDCLSLVTRPDSRWDRPNVVVENRDFMSEAVSAGRVAGVYTSLAAAKVDRPPRCPDA